MNTDLITAWTAIGALITSVVTMILNVVQISRWRVDLRQHTDMSMYAFAFEWDRFLIEHPDCAELLATPSPGTTLTMQERRLAEYRLDLAELTARKNSARLYDAESDFFDRLISIPLIRKALSSGEVNGSLKADFLAQCLAALQRHPA
jgi:hypothetical protein